jgi:oxepin-CoA hydrolase / 3-oxo-5,6-dehydrosuberyl-CoA semialdehyde dehydrogenase
MEKLENFVTGRWLSGEGEGQVLHDAVTGEAFTRASTAGLDFEAVLSSAIRRCVKVPSWVRR